MIIMIILQYLATSINVLRLFTAYCLSLLPNVFHHCRMHSGVPVATQGSWRVIASGELTLDPVSNDNEGIYQCFARNSAGINDALIVFGKSVCMCICMCVDAMI